MVTNQQGCKSSSFKELVPVTSQKHARSSYKERVPKFLIVTLSYSKKERKLHDVNFARKKIATFIFSKLLI